MNTFTEKTEQFLNEGTDNASRSLAIAVIDSVGGEDVFVNGKRTVDISEINFYEDNRSEVNVCLNKMAADLGVDSPASLVFGTGYLKKICTEQEITDVLDGQKTANYDVITNAITALIISDIEMSYISFLEGDDESTYFVDGEEIDVFDERY